MGDLRQGFHQAVVAESSRYLTAFRSSKGLYEFNRLPFGLKNAPGWFQVQMNNILAPYIGTCCFVFIDDLIIFGDSKKSFLNAIHMVMDCLDRHRLRLKLSKCKFGVTEVKFLGHIVSSNGIRMDEQRLQGVRDLVPPRDVVALRSFLGLVSYLRSFIKNLHDLVGPLQDLGKRGAKFVWTAVHDQYFNKIKDALLQAPLLHHIDYDLPIYVRAYGRQYTWCWW